MLTLDAAAAHPEFRKAALPWMASMPLNPYWHWNRHQGLWASAEGLQSLSTETCPRCCCKVQSPDISLTHGLIQLQFYDVSHSSWDCPLTYLPPNFCLRPALNERNNAVHWWRGNRIGLDRRRVQNWGWAHRVTRVLARSAFWYFVQ
jgi:hypothetical protein